ncbi:MAG: RhuM family protein [Thauera sp.]
MTDIAIFEANSGQIDVRLETDNVWLSLTQLVALFGRDKSVISRHIRNVLADGELGSEAVVAKFATTASDGKVCRVEHYNLDLIISTGYRVKSRAGIRFRQCASRIPKDHLTRGYTLDRQRLEHNARELEAALLLVRRTLSNAELTPDASSAWPRSRCATHRPSCGCSATTKACSPTRAAIRVARCRRWPKRAPGSPR